MAFTTRVPYVIIRRAESAPYCAVSSSLWKAWSSIAASSTDAARSRYSSVATRSTLGSSRPVAYVEAARSRAATMSTAAMVTSAGTAPRRRSSMGPSPIRSPSTLFIASRLTAWAAPRPASAASTVRAARLSARRASRRLEASRPGSRTTIARKDSSRKASACWFQPMS
ncbi:hypothetical protein RKD49_002013 [Streptomyces glaucescens]